MSQSLIPPDVYDRNLVIGVDPGLVCGIAWFSWFRRTRSGPYESTMIKLERDWSACCDYVSMLLDATCLPETRVVLAVERYTEGGGVRTAQPEALMTIGALAWLAHRVPSVRFLEQGAADAARAASRETLQQVAWWTVRDGDQHRNRAAAQVALAMLKLFPNEWSQLLESGRIDS